MPFPEAGLVYDYELDDGGASDTQKGDDDEEEKKPKKTVSSILIHYTLILYFKFLADSLGRMDGGNGIICGRPSNAIC